MFKILIAAAMIASSIGLAVADSNDAIKTCAELGKLTGNVAMQRDLGVSATDANINLLTWGLTPELANLVIGIVYVDNLYTQPGDIVGVTYVACMSALNK